MKQNYNYARPKLHLPEYGRHIQQMVDSLLQIEDREERSRQAKAVIAVMGNLNPLLRDTAAYTHKLWDHLFIMSDFQLDVDSPYPQLSRQELTIKPQPLHYPQRKVRLKHYGRYVQEFVRSLDSSQSPEHVAKTVDNIVRYMRSKSFEYNQEHPKNESIIKDLKYMSNGAIELDEDAIINIRSNYKSNQPQHAQKGAPRNGQRGRQQFGGRGFVKGAAQRRSSAK